MQSCFPAKGSGVIVVLPGADKSMLYCLVLVMGRESSGALLSDKKFF